MASGRLGRMAPPGLLPPHPPEVRRRVRRMRWGLVPPLAEEVGGSAPLINARSESVATKPSFARSLRHKRCLVPMDGWYEWLVESAPAEKGKAVKRPFYMSHADGSLLYMAGLWSVWRDRAQPDSAPLLSCTILTTEATDEFGWVHDRMPMVVRRNSWDDWLDPAFHDAEAAVSMLTAPLDLAHRKVSREVNKVGTDGPQLVEAVA